jgi:transposase
MSGATKSAGTAPKRTRAEWHTDFDRLRKQGMTGTAIAEKFGVGSPFVYAVLNDPDGSKDKARKASYGGTCVDCGKRTDGSNGRTTVPERCKVCRTTYQRTVLKHWTRERVIEAIQLFARENGRPPLSSDWAHARDSRYPVAGSCYRSTSRSTSPFRTWADAVEAAGFPRPVSGHYDRSHIVYPLRDAGEYALRRARQRRKNGITAALIATERGVSRTTASDLLARLWMRRLLERSSQPTGHRGPPHYVYHLSRNGASE